MDDTHTEGTMIEETLADEGIIPFADEMSPRRTIAEVGPVATEDRVSDPTADPGTRVSVVDRELGLEDLVSAPRNGRYECPCCGMGATRVVRVRIVNRAGWAAVCAVCAASLLEKLPGTIVGGMVKPSRKRRINRIKPARNTRGRRGDQSPHGFRGDTAGGLRQAG